MKNINEEPKSGEKNPNQTPDDKEKYWKKFVREISGTEYFWLLLFLFLLFQPFTTKLISRVFVQFIFQHFPVNGFGWFPLFIIVLSSFWLIYFFYLKLWKTRHLIRYSTLLGAIAVLFLYGIHRCGASTFHFYPLIRGEIWSGIKMMDIPMILFLGVVLILVMNIRRLRSEKRMKYSDGFIRADIPFKDIDQDKYGRTAALNKLLDILSANSVTKEKSVTIGLVNRWGEGKTTFLYLLEKKLKTVPDVICINFNPWLSSQPEQLTVDFFNTLDEELSTYIYTGRLFRQYAQNLKQLNSAYNPLHYLPPKLLGQRSNREYFKLISELIIKLNRRIFILIDDMDRLHPKEVFELLRMIRNSANFPHVIFVVPFERAYVIEALKENKISNVEEYLKKIFDVERSLPPIPGENIKLILTEEFEKLLDLILNEDETAKSDENPKKELLNQFEDCIRKNLRAPEPIRLIQETIFSEIKNKRDVIRFMNSLYVSMKDNYNNIFLPDLLLLELIKITDVSIYHEILKEHEEYMMNEMFAKREYLGTITTGPGSSQGINDDTEVEKDPFEDENPNPSTADILKNMLFDLKSKPDYNCHLSFSHRPNRVNYF